MAIRKITQADTRKTFALYNSADVTQLTDIANATTRVRFVNTIVGADRAPKVVEIDATGSTIPRISGWADDFVDSIELTVDGQTIDLMYDPVNNLWQVVNQYVPQPIAPYTRYTQSTGLPEPTPDLLWRINFTDGGGVGHYGQALADYYLIAAGVQLYDPVLDASGYGPNMYATLGIPGLPALLPGTAVIDYINPNLITDGPMTVSWIDLAGNDENGDPLLPYTIAWSAFIADSIAAQVGSTATPTRVEIYDANVQLVGTFPAGQNDDSAVQLRGISFPQAGTIPIPTTLAGTAYSVWMYGSIGAAPMPGIVSSIYWQVPAGKTAPVFPDDFTAASDLKVFLGDNERSNVVPFSTVNVEDYPLLMFGFEAPQRTHRRWLAATGYSQQLNLMWERSITAADGCEVSFSSSGPWTSSIVQQLTPLNNASLTSQTIDGVFAPWIQHDYVSENNKLGNQTGLLKPSSFGNGVAMNAITYYTRRIDAPGNILTLQANSYSNTQVQVKYQYVRPQFVNLTMLPIGGQDVIAAKSDIALAPNTTLYRYNPCPNNTGCPGGDDSFPGIGFSYTHQATISWLDQQQPVRGTRALTPDYVGLDKDFAFRMMAVINQDFADKADTSGPNSFYDSVNDFPAQGRLPYDSDYNGPYNRFPYMVQMSQTATVLASGTNTGTTMNHVAPYHLTAKWPTVNGTPIRRRSDWPITVTPETNTETTYTALYSLVVEPGMITMCDDPRWVDPGKPPVPGATDNGWSASDELPESMWQTADNYQYRQAVISFNDSPTNTSDGYYARIVFNGKGNVYTTAKMMSAAAQGYYPPANLNDPKPSTSLVYTNVEGVPTKSASVIKYLFIFGGYVDPYFTEFQPWDSDLAITISARATFNKPTWVDPLQANPEPNDYTFAMDLPYYLSDTPAIGVAGGVNSAAVLTNLFRDDGDFILDTASVLMQPAVTSTVHYVNGDHITREQTMIIVDLPTEAAAFPGTVAPTDDKFMLIDGELMQIISIVAYQQYPWQGTGFGADIINYIGVTVKRGVLDTGAYSHEIGDVVTFFTSGRLQRINTYVPGNTDYKLVPTTKITSLALDAAPTFTVDSFNRANKPLPPGNVRINSSYDGYAPDVQVQGDLTVTWSHRNRLDKSLIGFYETVAVSEPGVTYTVGVYKGDTQIVTVGNLTGTSYTFAKPVDAVGDLYTMRINSVRDGLVSDTYILPLTWGLSASETIVIVQPQTAYTPPTGDNITITVS